MAGDTSLIGVYRIKNMVNGNLYVGSTKQSFRVRWNKHKSELRRNIHHCQALQRAWNKYGESQFSFDILEVCLAEHCFAVEDLMLSFYRGLPSIEVYNVLAIAGKATGYKHTPESLEKMRIAGRNASPEARERTRRAKIGKPRPAETRAKLAKANTGKKQSPETIEKRRASMRGKKQSPETIEKIRIANTGRIVSPETRAKIAAAATNISDETREKMAAAKRGRKRSPESIAKRLAAIAMKN